MTAQMLDTVNYQTTVYGLADSNGAGLFHPNQLGLEVRGWSTGNWRGYLCNYQVIDGALYLTAIYLGLASEFVESIRRGEHPDVFGKIPYRPSDKAEQLIPGTDQIDPFLGSSPAYRVGDLREPIAFTGGMVIARYSGGPALFHHFGFFYEILFELVFDMGHLIEAHDRSGGLAEFRESMLLEEDWSIVRNKVREWASTRFKFQYHLFHTLDRAQSD